MLRLRWVDLPHLPRPPPQVPILASDGTEIHRIDLGVEEIRFGAEYDGVEWHSDEEDLDHDRKRRTWLRCRRRWTIEPVRKENVFGANRDVERILIEGIIKARRRLGEFRVSR